MITITVTGESAKSIATELAMLAEKFGGTQIIKEAVAHHATVVAINKAKEPVAPEPAQLPETISAAEAKTPEAQSSDGPIKTYDDLRAFVAPLLANPETKGKVSKVVKKYCKTSSLMDISPADYDAVYEALK